MFVRDLARLLESGEYQRCLEEAEHLLADGEHDIEEQARIQAVICRSRLELTDYTAAVDAGQEAVALATQAHLPDVAGFALVDLALAYARLRRHIEAAAALERFLADLPQYTAARCAEGIALRRLATVKHHARCSADSLNRWTQARDWCRRYGDERGAAECHSAIARLHLERGEPERAIEPLQAADAFAASHPLDREFLAEHLLDRASFRLEVGQYQEAANEAFQALEVAQDHLALQCRSQLLLTHSALRSGRPKDALNFALGARVSAIDGRLYEQEFEASEVLFTILREHGVKLLYDLEAEYAREGVNIFDYLSEQVVQRMAREQP